MFHQLRGLTNWWTRLPMGGRLIIYVFSGGSIFMLFTFLFGMRPGLILMGIVLAAALIFFLIKLWAKRQEKRRSDAAQRVLLDGISRSEGSGIDESQEERDVRKRLEDRWKTVYTTLHERNYDYYSFPWYLIIGPAQSGKTTTIQKSDQEFPIGDKPVADYGGTRGCNWFFTNQAILIDTAGRYVEHLGGTAGEWNSMLARDQEEWNTFLDLLRRMRPRSPINGVILTIKLADIVEADPKSRQKLVDTLRRALLDIEERLKIRVPVYILVTMCDKLVGFVDFFSHLPGLADRTLFGWSRPGDFARPIEAEEFPPAFAGLKEKLDRMLIEFLEEDAGRSSGSAADLQRMDRLMSFPDEFATLGPHLQDILTRVFAPSAYNEHHYFRGVYFTSGLQEGRPVLSACRALVGDRAGQIQEEDVAEISPESKAFFIADLYAEKVFREAGLVRLTRRAHREQRRRKIIYASVSAVIALAVTLWVLLSAHGVNKLGRDPRKALNDAVSAGPMLGSSAGDKRLLGGMDDLTTGLRRLDEEGSNLAARAIAEATDEAHRAYTMLFARRVLRPLVLDLLKRCEAPDAGPALRSFESIDRLNSALCYLHGLGHAKGPRDFRPIEGDDEAAFTADVDGLFACLESIRKLHLALLPDNVESTVEPNYGRVLELRSGLADAIAEREAEYALPDEVLDVFRDGSMRDRIEKALDLRVVGFWQDYADRLDTREAESPVPAPQGNPDLMNAWFWGELSRRNRIADEIIAELTTPLSLLIQGSISSLTQYAERIQTPWSQRFPRLKKARQEITEHWENNFALYGQNRPDAFLGDKLKAFKLQYDALEIVWARTSDHSAALKTRTTALGSRLDALAASGSEPWTRLARAGQRWSGAESLEEVSNLASLVLCEGEPHRKYLQAENPDEFSVFGGPNGVETVLEQIRSNLKFKSDPNRQPRTLAELLDSGARAMPGLETRIRTWIYADLIEMLEDRDETRARAFRDLVLDHDKSAPEAEAVRFTADNSKLLTDMIRHLLDGYQTNRGAVWTTDADRLPKLLGNALHDYLKEFEDYWSAGIQPWLAERESDRNAIESAIAAGDPSRLKRALERVGSLKTLLAARAEFAGNQADGKGPQVDALDKVLRKLDLNPVSINMKRIQGLWSHYARPENQKELSAKASALDGAFERLSTAARDLELYRRSRSEEVRTGLRGADDLKVKWSELHLHPLLDTLIAFSGPTRKALDALPRSLFVSKWSALLNRAEQDDLRGRFPFLSASTPRENRGTLAEWDKVRGFLASDELAFLVSMTEGTEDDAIDAAQVEFLRHCAQLRKFLGLDRENPDEPYTVGITVARAKQTGDSASLLEFNAWRSVFQVGDSAASTEDFILPVIQEPVGPFEWEPGRRLRFLIQCWNREKSEPGKWVAELPYRFAPEDPNWAAVLILALGGPSPESPEPVEGARPVLLAFRHSGTGDRGHLAFWFKTEPNPLPEQLPDLEKVWKIGRD